MEAAPPRSPLLSHLISRGAPEDVHYGMICRALQIASGGVVGRVKELRTAKALGLRAATPYAQLLRPNLPTGLDKSDVLCSWRVPLERVERLLPLLPMRYVERLLPWTFRQSLDLWSSREFEEGWLLMPKTAAEFVNRSDWSTTEGLLRDLGFEWLDVGFLPVTVRCFTRPSFTQSLRFLDIGRHSCFEMRCRDIGLAGPISMPNLRELVLAADMNGIELHTPALETLRITTLRGALTTLFGSTFIRLLDSGIRPTSLTVDSREVGPGQEWFRFESVLAFAFLKLRRSVVNFSAISYCGGRRYEGPGSTFGGECRVMADAAAALRDLRVLLEGCRAHRATASAELPEPEGRRAMASSGKGELLDAALDDTSPLPLESVNFFYEACPLQPWLVPLLVALGPRFKLRSIELTIEHPCMPEIDSPSHPLSLIRYCAPSITELCWPYLVCPVGSTFYVPVGPCDTTAEEHIRLEAISFPRLRTEFTKRQRFRSTPWNPTHHPPSPAWIMQQDTDARAWRIVEREFMRAFYLPHLFHSIRERLRAFVGRECFEATSLRPTEDVVYRD